MADDPAVISRGAINDVSLSFAYDRILSILDRNGLIATAAFVSSFACNVEMLYDNIALFEELERLNPIWFASIVERLKTGVLDGWRGAEHYKAMSAAGCEMAWHGATHQPLSQDVSDECLTLELELASRFFTAINSRPETIVFPRNRVGHLKRLLGAGFKTYRDSDEQGVFSKVVNLSKEFNWLSPCEMSPPRQRDGWWVCPPGHFLNWPSGVRAAVPVALTVARWKSMLCDAAERGGYVHMWFHPHNLITAPAILTSFEAILNYAGELKRKGYLSNPTMEQSVAFLGLE